MKRILHVGAGMILPMTIAVAAQAGPLWEETDDAGSSSTSAQVTMGMGAMAGIAGGLGGTGPGDLDFEDMFYIRIVDPLNFSARTDDSGGGFANFNTQIWLFRVDELFDPDAFGILANDDIDDGVEGSGLFPESNDGSGANILDAPGLYLIGITRFNNNPSSANGLIFDQQSNTEISGPDGPGGAMPHSGWTGDDGGFDGVYQIAFTGVEFAEVPAPGAIGLFVLAGLGARRRRR